MAEKIISPGVFTNEIDQSFLPAAVADIGGCVIGPTTKGPALVPTVVTSFSEYQKIFGSTFSSGSNNEKDYYRYLTDHTAEQYLKHNDKLTVVRILAGSFSGASVTISSSTDPAIVGGGEKPKAVFTISSSTSNLHAHFTASGTEISASLGNVNFIFTGSGYLPQNSPNTATQIFVPIRPAGQGGNVLSASHALRDAINNSSSLHGLTGVSASVGVDGSPSIAPVTMSYSRVGRFGTPTSAGGSPVSIKANKGGGGSKSGSIGLESNLGSISGLGVVSGSATYFFGGKDFNDGAHKNVFTLNTLADGETMTSRGATNADFPEQFESNNKSTSGSKDNVRFQIGALNISKGTFTLNIRRGDDVENRKQILESFTNINLDPNSKNYIGKAVGTQYQSIQTDENGKPFLQLVGDYPNKSKYVRVSDILDTPDYLDENGDLRLGGQFSASLPSFFSGSNSGSTHGGFVGGSDGTVQHPKLFYNSIAENNSQGLDPSDDATSEGTDDYIKALDLISNQDDYDINLILVPGIIDSIHTKVASKVIDVCEDRGDCFAILDPVEWNKNVTNANDRGKARNSNYAGMYWPWVNVTDSQTGRNRWVPPSVMVAGVYAFNDKVSHEWFAPAGLNRGTIDVARQAERKLTKSDRDSLYDNNINPIATFPGQGVTVFGQKTLQKKPSALDRINVRRLLIKVKKFIASSSRFLVFEQNTSATRRRFLSIATPFLEQVQADSGVNAFRVVMDETNNTPDTIDRNQLVGQLFIQPTRTAEFIVLDFTIQPTGASFPE